MTLVGSTPFGALVALFALVPLGIVIGIYAGESVGALRGRLLGSRRP